MMAVLFLLAEGFFYCCLHLFIIEFANHDDSIGKMSLLWREKSGEPCHDCNDQSTKRELICSICGKVWFSISLLKGYVHV